MNKKYIGIILFAVIVSLLLTSCDLLNVLKSDEELIRDRIDAFLESYNTGDFEDVLESLDKRTRNQYRAMTDLIGGINIGGGLGGVKLSGKIDISKLFAVSVGAISEDDLMKLNIKSIDINDKKATVYAEMYYSSTHADKKIDVKIIMVKENNDWYIRDMTD